jgi:peptidoglycan-N-acetylglucosamine deacetylase
VPPGAEPTALASSPQLRHLKPHELADLVGQPCSVRSVLRFTRTSGAVVAGSVIVAVAWMLLPFAVRKVGERRLAARCREHGLLVLTYDDGPANDAMTTRLLGVLGDHHASANFFMIGDGVLERVDVVERVLAAGHEVGSHSQHHRNAWKSDPVRVGLDVAAGVRTVDGVGGTGSLFRPPFGKLTLASLIHARLARLQLAWWTIDSRDSWDRRPIEDVLNDIDVGRGGVVLMHDSTRANGDRDDHEDYVVDLTARALELAERNGLGVVTMSELASISRTPGNRR